MLCLYPLAITDQRHALRHPCGVEDVWYHVSLAARPPYRLPIILARCAYKRTREQCY